MHWSGGRRRKGGGEGKDDGERREMREGKEEGRKKKEEEGQLISIEICSSVVIFADRGDFLLQTTTNNLVGRVQGTIKRP